MARGHICKSEVKVLEKVEVSVFDGLKDPSLQCSFNAFKKAVIITFLIE